MRGRLQRGVAGGGAFKRTTGDGYVAPIDGAYKRAQACGVLVEELLVETFGGLGEHLVRLLQEAAEHRNNQLSAAEYDETTWAARTWLSFAHQRLSVAVHKAVINEAKSYTTRAPRLARASLHHPPTLTRRGSMSKQQHTQHS